LRSSDSLNRPGDAGGAVMQHNLDWFDKYIFYDRQ
jgi:hypothetical protein